MTSSAEHLNFLTGVHKTLESILENTNQELSHDDIALRLLKKEDPLPDSVQAESRIAEHDEAASQEVTVTFDLSDAGSSGHIRIEQYEALQTIFTFNGVTFPDDWVGVSKGRLRLRAIPTKTTYYKGSNKPFFPECFWRCWKCGEVLILKLYLGTELNPYETVIGWYVGSAIARSCYGSGEFVSKK